MGFAYKDLKISLEASAGQLTLMCSLLLRAKLKSFERAEVSPGFLFRSRVKKRV